jgi:hypothetical protein
LPSAKRQQPIAARREDYGIVHQVGNRAFAYTLRHGFDEALACEHAGLRCPICRIRSSIAGRYAVAGESGIPTAEGQLEVRIMEQRSSRDHLEATNFRDRTPGQGKSVGSIMFQCGCGNILRISKPRFVVMKR